MSVTLSRLQLAEGQRAHQVARTLLLPMLVAAAATSLGCGDDNGGGQSDTPDTADDVSVDAADTDTGDGDAATDATSSDASDAEDVPDVAAPEDVVADVPPPSDTAIDSTVDADDGSADAGDIDDATDGSGEDDAESDTTCVPVAGYVDGDNDGFGGSVATEGCVGDEGFSTQPGDCDDAASAVNPAAVDACDGVDNNCNGLIDEVEDGVITWADLDGDEFGDIDSAYAQCAPSEGRIQVGGDCDDDDDAVNPDADEVACDGIDNDCDGMADDYGCRFEDWLPVSTRPRFMAIDEAEEWIYWGDILNGVYRARLNDGGAAGEPEVLLNGASNPRGISLHGDRIVITDASGVIEGNVDGTNLERTFSYSAYGSAGLADLFDTDSSCSATFSRSLRWRDHLVIGFGSGNCGPLLIVDPEGEIRAISDNTIVGDWVEVYDDALYYGRPVCRLDSPDAEPVCYGTENSVAGYAVDGGELFGARPDGIDAWDLAAPEDAPEQLESWSSCGFGFFQTNLVIEQGVVYAFEPCTLSMFAVSTDRSFAQPIAGTPSCMVAMVSTPGALYVSECNRNMISRLRIPFMP